MQRDVEDRSPPLLRINDDVLHEICKAVLSVQEPTTSAAKSRDIRSLQSLASTCKQLRFALAPHVFRNLSIHIPEGDSDWLQATAGIQALCRCQLLREHVRQCVLEICSGTARGKAIQSCGRPTKLGRLIRKVNKVFQGEDLYEDSPGLEEHTPPPPGLASQLATLLCGMSRLDTLAIAPPTAHISLFRTAFEDANLTLPTVKTLAIGPGMEWLIFLCPNANIITTQNCPQWTEAAVDHEKRPVQDLLSVASTAKTLDRLELYIPCEPWTVEMVLKAVPNIPELFLSNDHGPLCLWNPANPLHLGANVLSTLSKFSQLRRLEIPGIASTPAWPWCGNAFDGPEGQLLYESLVKETEEANREAASKISATCPKLETLRVAWNSAWAIERDRDGTISGLEEVTCVATNRGF